MPRGGLRWSPGRPGWKAKAEHCLPLDIRTLQRVGKLRNGYAGELAWRNYPSGAPAGNVRLSAAGNSVHLKYTADSKPCSQVIAIARTRCYFGGTRGWLVCPICIRRFAVLYGRDERFACRRCQQVAYQSQSETAIRRLSRRLHKIEAKLADNGRRPKGMHAATYERLLNAICRFEDKWYKA
jgi:hypothetical protein